MDFSSLRHQTDSNYSYPNSNNTINLILVTKKNDNFKKVFLVYHEKYKFTRSDEHYEVELTSKESDAYNDYYKITIAVKDLRFGYVYKFIDHDDKIYYYHENGIEKEEDFNFKETQYDFFQVPFINPIDVTRVNEKFKNRVFYQIFVDRFFRPIDAKENTRINIKWNDNNEITPRTIAGGTLKGIIQKLDYLKELGISGIYLTPIFEAYSNHKYETYDYYTIASDFGTKEDLKELVEKAHKLDILIVLDGVFNHVAFYHPFFEDVLTYGKESKYYNYFMIHNNDIEVTLEKKNFESFGYGFHMPKLNMSNLEVQEYCVNVLKYYKKEFNIDGFRLDVADEVAHSFWKYANRELKKIDKDNFMIAENWHDAHLYLDNNDEFDSVMNYSLLSYILKYVATNKLTSEEFKNGLVNLKYRYKENTNHNLLNLLDSHDTKRFLNYCDKNEDKFLLGFSILFLCNGIPMIYYGDETGLTGEHDPHCRKMFNREDFNVYNNKIGDIMRKIIDLRNKELLNEYDFKIDYIKEKDYLEITLSKDEGNKVIKALINYNYKNPKTINLIDLIPNTSEILYSLNYDNKEKDLFNLGIVVFKN